MSELSLHNLAGLARWSRVRLSHRGRIGGGVFFLDRRARLTISGAGRLEVGPGSIVLKDFTARIEAPARLGRDTFFDPGCHLVVTEGLEIGDGALIWEYVTIDDSPRPDRPDLDRRAIHIGTDVSIGPRATILAGVHVGDRCIIGAHALVEDDLPAGSVAFGVPARVVRSLAPVARGEAVRA